MDLVHGGNEVKRGGAGAKLYSTLGADDWHSVVLNRSAMAVFRFLGLYDAIAEGPRSHALAKHVVQHGGSRSSAAANFSTAPLGDGSGRAGAYSVDAAWLRSLLLVAARRREISMPGERTRLHKLSVNRPDGLCLATFRDGRAARSYDVVVAADGTESPVRMLLFDQFKLVQPGYQAMHTVIRRPADVSGAVQLENWDPLGKKLVLTPLAGGDLLVSLFSKAKFDPRHLRAGARPVADMTKSLVAGPATGGVASVIDALKQAPAKQECVVEFPGTLEADQWYAHQTLLLGNAAATPEPFMGARQSMEIEMAWFLSQAVSTANGEATDRSALHAAIAKFEKQQKKRVSKALRFCKMANGEATKRTEVWPAWRKLKLRWRFSSRAITNAYTGLITAGTPAILSACTEDGE